MTTERLEPKWLCEHRLDQPHDDSEASDYNARSEIYRDLGELIHLGQFRRLSKKTQVYSNPDTSVRSRLTHSLEVSNVAVQLVRLHRKIMLTIVKENESNDSYVNLSDAHIMQKYELISKMDDLSCFASLAHDLGHPPFAHSGERFLKKNCECRRFDSNLQNLRILSRLHPFGKINSHSFTFATLDSILKEKHQGPFCKDAFSLDQKSDEQDLIEKISERTGTSYEVGSGLEKKIRAWIASISHMDKYKYRSNVATQLESSIQKSRLILRHPITYFMEAADDISYIAADIEDALKKGYIHHDDFLASCSNYRIAPLTGAKLNHSPTESEVDELWEPILSRCHKKQNYSGIKSSLIRMMIVHMSENFNVLLTKYLKRDLLWETSHLLTERSSKEKIKYTVKEYLDLLPLILGLHSIEEFDGVSEIGNLLYLNCPRSSDLGTRLYEFKKSLLSDRIVNIKEVTEGDEEGTEVLSLILRNIFPPSCAELTPENQKEFKAKAKKMSGYLSHEYSSEVWKIANRESITDKDVKKIQNVFLDFVASMSDSYAIEFASQFRKKDRILESA